MLLLCLCGGQCWAGQRVKCCIVPSLDCVPIPQSIIHTMMHDVKDAAYELATHGSTHRSSHMLYDIRDAPSQPRTLMLTPQPKPRDSQRDMEDR